MVHVLNNIVGAMVDNGFLVIFLIIIVVEIRKVKKGFDTSISDDVVVGKIIVVNFLARWETDKKLLEIYMEDIQVFMVIFRIFLVNDMDKEEIPVDPVF